MRFKVGIKDEFGLRLRFGFSFGFDFGFGFDALMRFGSLDWDYVSMNLRLGIKD